MENISHDSVNRFLDRERFDHKDLYDEMKDKIEIVGGTLSNDDSVLDIASHTHFELKNLLNITP